MACDFAIAMRNLYVVCFSLNLLHVAIVTEENVTERAQPEQGGPMAATKNVAFPGQPLSWPLSSSEESHGQDVIGEYADLPEGTEVSLLDPDDKGTKVSRPTKSSAEELTEELSSKRRTQTPSVQELSTIVTQSMPSRNVHQPSLYLDQKTTLSVPPGPDWNTGHPTPTDSGSWTTSPFIGSKGRKQSGTVTVEKDTEDIKYDDLHVSSNSVMVLFDGNMQTSGTPCRTLNQSWTSPDPDNVTSSESLQPPLAFSSALFVPLYSDWNSALATWGFAWEAHIYGLGSVFAAFCLISVVCLLGLPLRCPSGIPYFILLHFFLAAFAGIQAFSLIYDAYSHQDRLSPLFSLLLLELPFPCSIAAFSLAIFLLSLRSRMYLPLHLANSTSFSILPKPCPLLCMSLLQFAASLGCVGILELFHSLPTVILLLPQAIFVCLTIVLTCSYLIFYCLVKVNTKHVYRLNDSGESGGSPELVRDARCPFAKTEDWDRAAGAGVGASLCLLGCGGLQVYSILHALGLGGVEGYGFHPWPWWGFHIGCRLCEVGVCLGLSLIGTHPLFCHNKASIRSLSHSRPGSWSRLSCSLPPQGLTLPPQGAANSPVASTQNSWNKQEILNNCDATFKRHSEALPLFSMTDSPDNGLDCVAKTSQNQTTILPLPTPTSPPHKLQNTVLPRLPSQDSLQLDTDSTIDLRPPTPINLSRSIDQALFSESIFSPSIFGMPRMFYTSSSQSLTSPGQEKAKQGLSSVEGALYRTSSCGDVDQENVLSSSRPSHPHSSLTPQVRPQTSPVEWDWKASVSGSTQGLCGNPKETKKLRSHSWANRGQNFTQSSIPRAIPHLSHHRRYRTLSLASQDSRGSCRLADTKHLSESKQLEWDLAVQAEFVNVCKQIDAFSVCSDTIEL